MLLLMAAIASGADVDAVVRVEAGSSECAGALVDASGTVLTAYHCVAGSAGRARITTKDDRVAVGRVRAWDVAADVAVLSAPDLAGTTYLSVRSTDPSPGEVVRAWGHPYGAVTPAGYFEGLLRWTVTEGVVSGVGVRAVQFDVPVNPGNSGGPVVDADGAIASVVSRRLSGDGLGFGARPGEISAAIAEPARKLGPIGGTLGLGLRLWSLESLDGGVSIGPEIEVALRDRLILSGDAAVPVSGALSAVRFGAADAVLADGRVGLRQRFGRGAWALKLDVLGGVADVDHWTGEVDHGRIDVSARSTLLASGAAAVHLRNLGVEVGMLSDQSLRVGVSVRWPGTIAVF
jgi:S1-C subfamily serine protease